MRRLVGYILLLCCLAVPSKVAADAAPAVGGRSNDVATINAGVVAAYTDSLRMLVQHRDAKTVVEDDGEGSLPSPYYYKLFCGGALYQSALSQKMGYSVEDSAGVVLATRSGRGDGVPRLGDTRDNQLVLETAINEQLSRAYTLNPGVFSTTQTAIMGTTKLKTDLDTPIQEKTKLADKVKTDDVPQIRLDDINPIAHRPNFWAFKGNGSLQFSQNYFTENWYQGGTNNLSMIAKLYFELNYNHPKGIQWNNSLDVQLGFQTTENSVPKFRATTNLIRLTTKIGYKMVKNWNYSGSVVVESQPFPVFDNKGEEVKSTFASPMTVRTSIGLDWSFKLKKFSGNMNIAPISHNMTYVHREAIRSRYGVAPSSGTKHDFGPNITARFTWNIVKNVTWTNRTFWFSNLKMTRLECENTFSFTINKYLSSTLFLYPRFDDSTKKHEDNGYFMFKEWLSLGLNYSF